MDIYARLMIFYMQVLSLMEDKNKAKKRTPNIMQKKLRMGNLAK